MSAAPAVRPVPATRPAPAARPVPAARPAPAAAVLAPPAFLLKAVLPTVPLRLFPVPAASITEAAFPAAVPPAAILRQAAPPAVSLPREPEAAPAPVQKMTFRPDLPAALDGSKKKGSILPGGHFLFF